MRRSSDIDHIIKQGVFGSLCERLKRSGQNQSLHSHIIDIIKNVMSKGHKQQFVYVVDTIGLLEALCVHLKSGKIRVALNILSELKSLFSCAERNGLLNEFKTVSIYYIYVDIERKINFFIFYD